MTGFTFGGTADRVFGVGPIYDGYVAKKYKIRTYGDPVLKEESELVTEIDGKLVKVCNNMVTAMYEAPGLGLAAPQVGIGQRFFVYDLTEQGFGDGPSVLINPEVVESSGEWAYDEGCLSVPELSWTCLLYTSPSPRDATLSRMPSSA